MSSLEWLNNAFMYVLEYSFYAAMIAFVVFIIRALLAKRFPAMFSYALWGIVLIRLLIPVSLPLPTIFDFSKAQESQGTQTPDESEIVTVGLQDIDYNGQTATDNTQNLSQNIKSESNTNPTASKRTQQYTFDPSLLLGTMWLLGAAALLSRTAILYLYTSRRLKDAVPLDCHDLAKECAAMVGVHCVQDICISAQFQAPVLFGILRPRIILPVSAIDMSKTQLKHVLLHEMVHKKRGDMWLKALWTVVLYVNWFNPILWFADPLYSRDMERACDEHVIRLLGLDSKKAYAISLLNVALNMNQNTTSDKALAFAKGNVKRRIEGVLSLKRFSKAMTALSLAIVLCLCVVMIAACQPTPKNEPVVGRQEDILDTVTAGQSDTSGNNFIEIETPDHITQVHDEFSKLNLSYDADVLVPETNAYPVTEVKKRVFSDDEILSFIALITHENDKLYSEWNLTKDEWFEKLTKVKQYEDSGIVNPEWLKYLQESYDHAKSVVENHLVNISKIPQNEGGSYLYVKNENNTVSKFLFKHNENILVYERNMYLTICPASEYEDKDYDANWDSVEHFQWCKPGEPNISQEDAYKIASEYTDSMGIDLSLYYVQPCTILVDGVDKTTGWQFTFTRAISNLHMYFDTGGCYVNPEALPSFGSPWGEETCTIAVDQEGICFLNWRGASELSRTVMESAQLEPFDTIQQRITNQLNYIFGAADNGSGGLDIKITEIKLGISMISVKNQSDIGEYIPTWYVSFSKKFRNSDDWSQEQIMFSALDGSYIEPRVTNTDLMGHPEAESELSG